MNACFYTIDIGGTNTRVAAFKNLEAKNMINFVSFKTSQDPGKGMTDIISAINQVKAVPKGIGVSVAIPFDNREKTLFSSNIPKWTLAKIREGLKGAYGINACILNDASAGAIAEALERNEDGFVYLTWGTGVGGVNVKKNGDIFHLYEYEPGHQMLVENGKPCVCGKKGCLEAYIGGKSIESNYHKGVIDLEDKEWDEVLRYAADGIEKILRQWPEEKVVMNGQIITKHPNFLAKLEDMLTKRLGRKISFESAKTGEKSPLYGTLKFIDNSVPVKIHKLTLT